MDKSDIRIWKKAYEKDVAYVVTELKEIIGIPSLVILTGDVGVGKTTFVKYFSDNKDTVSPTYSIISDYGAVLHADFYRIKDASEIAHLELELYLEDKDFLLVEWGEPYLYEIKRELEEDFECYELFIEMNEENKEHRNYILRKYKTL